MYFIVVVSLVILVIITYLFIKNKEVKVEKDEMPYKIKFFLLSKNDRLIYNVLLDFANKNNMLAFPRVRLTDFLWIPKYNRNAYLKVQNKFVDFLFVDADKIQPIAAVFINDENNKSKMISKFVIKNACIAANLKLIEFECSIELNQVEGVLKEQMEV